MVSSIKKKYYSLPIQVKASFWFLICSFMQKGISSITTPIFTRLLTTEEYGNYNAFSSWLSVITIFVSLHLYSGVYTSGLVKFKEERKVFSSSLQGLSLLLTICWTIIYLMFRSFWNSLFNLTTIQMLAMLVMIWASSAFNFWAAAQRVEYKYKALVIVTIIVSLLKPSLGVLFVINSEDKVTARILGLLLAELIGYTGLFISQMKEGKVFFSNKFWKYSLLFNLPLVPHYLSQTILNSADRIMIRDMVGAGQAGIYSLAYSVSQIMTIFNSSLTGAVSPWMYQKIKEKKIQAIANISYLTLSIIAIVNLLLICLAPEIIAIFAPPKYHEAIWVIPPVAMSVFFIFMYDYFARFELYYEKTTFMMLASVLGACLNVVLNYYFIQAFGYIAAGYTTLICYIFYVIAHYCMMRRICNKYHNGEKAFELKYLILISVAFICCGFLLMLTYQHMYLRYSLVFIFLVMCIIKKELIKKQIKRVLHLRKEAHTK
ncbi:MAG: oligosaccharide flippase family protein [Lachnospiraceae bacterium]|nr:oligosaccharide flippase family protein [Lachnospiraceae bacterium]